MCQGKFTDVLKQVEMGRSMYVDVSSMTGRSTDNLQMSEEIKNAALVVPRSIMTAVMINGSLGFAMVLNVLYRSGDIDAALAENPSYPFLAIFKHAVGSTSAAAVMASVVFCLSTSAAVGSLASSSRVFWAFARGKGLHATKWISQLTLYLDD